MPVHDEEGGNAGKTGNSDRPESTFSRHLQMEGSPVLLSYDERLVVGVNRRATRGERTDEPASLIATLAISGQSAHLPQGSTRPFHAESKLVWG
jgi:hypothetical protein